MSRALQLLDSTVLLILSQTWRVRGRWHVAECEFLVRELRPSYRTVPPVITDSLVYRLSYDTGRPKGYRLMTVPELEAWHRDQACWQECGSLQEYRPDGLTYHIERNCAARCRAVQETIARNAVTLGTTEARIRTLAVRRHKSRRYRSDDGDDLRALYGLDRGGILRRDRVRDRSGTARGTIAGVLDDGR